jgi:hypothetical protein
MPVILCPLARPPPRSFRRHTFLAGYENRLAGWNGLRPGWKEDSK